MSASRRLLVFGGLALLVFSMAYGLWYALLVEHQTLDGMGGALAGAFVHAAKGELPQARTALQQYAGIEFVYVRQVDAHSHWGGLALVMIILGALFDRISFAERTRRFLAIALLAGSALFPLGVLLQTVASGRAGAILAVVGSALIVAGMFAAALGFLRKPGFAIH